MKKLSRVVRKGDAASRRAQSKKANVSLASAVKIISESGDEIVNARAELGEEIGYSETGPSEEQFLFRTGVGYALAIIWTEFYGGGAWRRFNDWNTRAYKAGPLSKHRQCMVSRPITDEEALDWFRVNLVENIVPLEFHDDFRAGRRLVRRTKSAQALPANCIPMPASDVDYRGLILALLKLDSEADDNEIIAAMAVSLS